MKKDLTYSEAYSELEKLVEEMEGNVALELLAEKVKRANELIAVCEGKLRTIEKDVSHVINGKSGVSD